ncbi:MAG: YciI family protein [Chthonomonas sp.]|nr:YciI family protein [Chthonomonas sp.]
MAHYVLLYEFVDDFLARRGACRQEHLDQIWAAVERGEILLAGALEEPADSAILVFVGDGPEAAEEFAREDVYTRDGLITKWSVRKWNTVAGELASNITR